MSQDYRGITINNPPPLKLGPPSSYLWEDQIFEIAPSGHHRGRETVGNDSESDFRDLESMKSP